MTKTSEYSGFYKLSPQERIKVVSEFAELSEEEVQQDFYWHYISNNN